MINTHDYLCSTCMYIPIHLTCSASCGQNGIKVSTRVQIQLGSCEMSECYMKETKTDKCTSPCLNGRAIGGRCKCNDGFTGECCNVGKKTRLMLHSSVSPHLTSPILFGPSGP